MITRKLFILISLMFAINLALAVSASAGEEALDFDMMKKIYEEKKEKAVDDSRGSEIISGANGILKGGMMMAGPEYSSWEESFRADNALEEAKIVEEDEFLAAIKNKFKEHQLYFKIIKINNTIINALSSMQN